MLLKTILVFLAFELPLISAQVPINSTVLSSPRKAISSVSVGDRVLFVGGYDFNDIIASDKIDVFNVTNQTWMQQLSLPIPRGFVTPVVVDSNIYFLGGISQQNPPYQYSTRNFTTLEASGPTVRQPIRLSLSNSTFLALGSFSVDFFDLESGNWSYNSNLTKLMTLLHNEIAFGYQNYVFIIGGLDALKQFSTSAWIFNLNTNELKEYDFVITSNSTYNEFSYDVSNGILVVRLSDRSLLYHFILDKWVEESSAINAVSSVSLNDVTHLFGDTYVIYNWTQPKPDPVQADTNINIGFILNGTVVYVMNGTLVFVGKGRYNKPTLAITPPIKFAQQWTSDSYVFADSKGNLFAVYDSKKDITWVAGLGTVVAVFALRDDLYVFGVAENATTRNHLRTASGLLLITSAQKLSFIFAPVTFTNGDFVDPVTGVMPLNYSNPFVPFNSLFDGNILTAQDDYSLFVMNTRLQPGFTKQYKMMDIYNYLNNTWTTQQMPEELFLNTSSQFFQETFMNAVSFNDSIMVWSPGVYGLYNSSTGNWTTYTNITLAKSGLPIQRASGLKDLHFQIPVINGIAHIHHDALKYFYKFAPYLLTWNSTEPVPTDSLVIHQPVAHNDTLFVSMRDKDSITSLYFYDTTINQWQLTLLPTASPFVAIIAAGDYIIAVCSDNKLHIFSIRLGQWNTQELDYSVLPSTLVHVGSITLIAGGTTLAKDRYSDKVLIVSDDIVFIETPVSQPSSVAEPIIRSPVSTDLTVGELVAAIVVPIVVVLGTGLVVLLVLLRKHKKSKKVSTVVELDQRFGEWFTPFSEIQFGDRLGQGANGQVFKGTWKNTAVALKVSMTEANNSVISELSLMINLRPHPNVVQLLGYSVHPETSSVILILEYCNGGSVDKLLDNQITQISVSQKIQLLQDIARGIVHLHSNNIVHRDLAARNVLLHNGEAKITDFGMSRIVEERHQRGTTKSELGPIRWMAPESLGSKQYSTKSDVWSFGILMFEVITEQEPHASADPMTIGRNIRDNGLTPQLQSSSKCTDDLSALMRQCWHMSPAQRPLMETVLQRLEQIQI